MALKSQPGVTAWPAAQGWNAPELGICLCWPSRGSCQPLSLPAQGHPGHSSVSSLSMFSPNLTGSFSLPKAPSQHPAHACSHGAALIHLPAALGTAPHHSDLGSSANFPPSYQPTCPQRGCKGATGLCQRSHRSHHVQHVHCQLSQKEIEHLLPFGVHAGCSKSPLCPFKEWERSFKKWFPGGFAA